MVQLSHFLPDNYDASKSITLIAGKGYYPILVAKKIREKGISLKLLAFEGETLSELYDSFPEKDRAMIKVGQLGKFLKVLKEQGSKYAFLAGQITPRRLFNGLHLDLKALVLLAMLPKRNAETIFGLLIEQIEKLGMIILDGRAFLDDELATEGVMVGKLKGRQEHIDHGIEIAQAAAQHNIGQSVVVSKGTVLAVEAFEGTDEMLRRANSFGADEMIFVKTIKSNQDFRLDVPIFGEQTIRVLEQTRINTVFLEANKTIILDKKRVLEMAKQAKITLVGYKR